MLQPLNKIAQEIGLAESDAQRVVTYHAGLRRIGGQYDDRQFFLLYIKYLHEKLYGIAGNASATISFTRDDEGNERKD